MSRALVLLFSLVALCAALWSCGSGNSRAARSALDPLREQAPSSTDPDLVGRWLLGELTSPGGEPAGARKARARLDELRENTTTSHLARGVDDELHGRLRAAPDHYLKAAEAAKNWNDPNASLFAWFAIHRAMLLERNVTGLWKRYERFVQEAIKSPGNLGWRARTELVEWWYDEAYAAATGKLDEIRRKHHGCLKRVRLAGTFGRGTEADAYKSFPPEKPGPWPSSWRPEPGLGESPRVLQTRQHGCLVSADEPAPQGIFYVESFIDLAQPTELICAVQGALAVWIDDERVINRDPRIWGVWPKFGVRVRLGAGRHRILARVNGQTSSIRLLHPNGTPLGLDGSAEASEPYTLVPPQLGDDPNVLSRFLRKGDIVDPNDDLVRFVAAYMMSTEGQADVASVLIEPLIKDAKTATGPSLAMAAHFAQNDPLFDESMAEDLKRDLSKRAVKKDNKLWQPRLALALGEAEKAGGVAAVEPLRKLLEEFPEVSAVGTSLASLYGELSWTVEYSEIVKRMAERFPNHPEALHSAVETYESEGRPDVADKLVARIKTLDPDSEIDLTRALARDDYAAALVELKRIAERRPERKDIAERIYDVAVRAGNDAETWKKLEAALEKDPKDSQARLNLADARFAAGEQDALRRGLVDAVEADAWTGPLKDALDLIEGKTELEPYRIAGLPIIAAYEKSGKHMPGTAARILDYAAVWAHADGSHRMLEHEIIRIQSPEAIQQFAEHPRLGGLVLHMRVIKKDGRILEPEDVPGKPTVTMPHLEVGDYLETEHIMSQASESIHGVEYVGPRWFFREENIAYARSEFVVITPTNKPLIVETRGAVPKPEITRQGAVVAHRWRVDFSPAAPVEPHSAPIAEFLPSVQVAWGVVLENKLLQVAEALAPVTPIDPRILRIARRIVEPVGKKRPLERAKLLYRWVLSNVEQGNEVDGRRVIVGKNGNRWRGYMMLCRALGIEAEFALAQNRLAPPPAGPIERASLFTQPLMRIRADDALAWVTLDDRYAPFGYVPAEVRGMPLYLLTVGAPKLLRAPDDKSRDSLGYEGKVTLAHDGSARVELAQFFHGRFAAALRQALSEIPEAQVRDVVEARLLAPELRGARLRKYRFERVDDLDSPLVLRATVDVPSFAQPSGDTLILSPPFVPNLAQLAALPARQTPMLIREATDVDLRLDIDLPKGARIANKLKPFMIRDQDRVVEIRDRVENKRLVLDRSVRIPASRVQPQGYPDFVRFARGAYDALASSVRVQSR